MRRDCKQELGKTNKSIFSDVFRARVDSPEISSLVHTDIVRRQSLGQSAKIVQANRSEIVVLNLLANSVTDSEEKKWFETEMDNFPHDAVDTRARRLSAGVGDQEWECGDYEIVTHPLLPLRLSTYKKKPSILLFACKDALEICCWRG